MADKFRVGQRVRIIYSLDFPEAVGTICTITGNPYIDFLDYKMYPLSSGVSGEESCLEPVYDGDEKSSWYECLWKPKPIVHSIEDEITTDTGGE